MSKHTGGHATALRGSVTQLPGTASLRTTLVWTGGKPGHHAGLDRPTLSSLGVPWTHSLARLASWTMSFSTPKQEAKECVMHLH